MNRAPPTRVDLSICIPTWNRAHMLERVLEHLSFVHSLPFSVEIVVFDNASTDTTATLVERYQSQLPIRFFSQPLNLGGLQNISAALRCATGRYTVYLADDDRLIPDALVRHIAWLEERPDVVMLQAPWLLWDEAADIALGQFYRVDEVTTFESTEALACLEFLLSRKAFPEHAIYRTEMLHQLMHLPHSLYVNFLMVFRAFRFGGVGFHPDSYYRSLVRPDGGVAQDVSGQLGHRQAISFLDEYRGSLEVSLLGALREVVTPPIPAVMRDKALAMLNVFLLDRLKVAAHLNLSGRDFIAAHEFMQRAWLWCDDTAASEVVQWEQQYLPLIALQSVVEVLQAHSELVGLVLCGFSEPEGLLPGFAYFKAKVAVEVRSLDQAECAPDREQYLHLVAHSPQCARLVDAGLLAGRVLCFADIKDQFRVLPRSFTS